MKSLKNIKIICFVAGGCYTIFGTIALLTVKLQKIALSDFHSFPNQDFTNPIGTMHTIWNNYMPYVVLIGLCYVVFGLLLNKLGSVKFSISVLLGIGSCIWAVLYNISYMDYSKLVTAMVPEGQGVIRIINSVFSVIGFVGVLGILTIPQFIISRKLWKFQKKEQG